MATMTGHLMGQMFTCCMVGQDQHNNRPRRPRIDRSMIGQPTGRTVNDVIFLRVLLPCILPYLVPIYTTSLTVEAVLLKTIMSDPDFGF